MVSAIGGLRASHYDALGIEPDASRDDIERAFLFKVSAFSPHAFGNVAEASVAYETLKDPAKRRNYDRSNGFGPEPEVVKPIPYWSGRPWSMTPGQATVARPAIALFPQAPRPIDVGSPETLAEVRTANPVETKERSAEPRAEVVDKVPFIAAPPSPSPAPAPSVAPSVVREAVAPQPLSVSTLADPPRSHIGLRPIDLQVADTEQGTIDPRKVAIIAASIIVGVGVVGGWLGWAAGNNQDSPQQETVKTRLPQATEEPQTTIAVAEPAWQGPIAQANRPGPPARSASANSTAPAPSPSPGDSSSPSRPAEGPPPAIDGPGMDSEPVAAPAPDPAPAATALPLSSATIARTIERIGYPCGEVGSTAQGAAAGVFTVNCTSGHAYRASPVRGRYRFRPVARP
ncbi:MAG: hypothetical protein H0W71_06890 [Sphingomonas sp.]|nr:hypothetical protein [Sphingomonas sp.]